MNACLYHFFSVFSFCTLVNWSSRLFNYIHRGLIFSVKANALVKGHGKFVFVSHFLLHASVLESVISHFIKTAIFFSSFGFFIYSLFDSLCCFLEFLPCYFPILVCIELFHKHCTGLNILIVTFYLFFKRREAVGLKQKIFNFISCYVTTVILVTLVKAGFELFLGEGSKTLRMVRFRRNRIPNALISPVQKEFGGPRAVIPKKLIFVFLNNYISRINKVKVN